MSVFKKLTNDTVYTKVKSRDEAMELKERADGIVQQGKNVAIFFENRYLLHLASKQDPYQVRQAIDAQLDKFANSSPDPTIARPVEPAKTADKPKTESEPQNIPTRGAGGKFVSKKQSSSPKKKNIFGF